MKIHETGVLAQSNAYFHTASVTAEKLFFTVTCTGHYVCDGTYLLQRPSYDSFLLLFVMRGRGYCRLEGKKTPLEAGDFLLLDCYVPHLYGTDTGWEILWVHFDGVQARAYYETIAESKRQIIHPEDAYGTARSMERIYQAFHVEKRINEARISQDLTSILTEFLMPEPPRSGGPEHSARIEEIVSYISENLDKPLSLATLAQQASLSPFYFSRIFKRETGYTLQEYLVSTRINAAKFYLRTTKLPLKEITVRCGYGSASTFCTTFKSITGQTPMEYRNQNG